MLGNFLSTTPPHAEPVSRLLFNMYLMFFPTYFRMCNQDTIVVGQIADQITNKPRVVAGKKKDTTHSLFISFPSSKHRLSLLHSINTQKVVTDIPVLILGGVSPSVGKVKSDPGHRKPEHKYTLYLWLYCGENPYAVNNHSYLEQ